MLPVEIVPVDGSTLVLRARGSELLILPHHIGHLKGCKTPKEFTGYFLSNALLNRPARKLFEAWLRKDKTLWQRIYRTIHDDMEGGDEEKSAKAVKADKPAADKAPTSKPAAEKQAKSAEADKPAAEKEAPAKKKPAAKKKTATEKKAPAKKKTTTKKKSASSTKKAPAKKKSSSSAKKKSATKKTTKSATKKKTASKSTTKKKTAKKKKG